MSDKISIDQLVEMYRKLREKKSEIDQEYKARLTKVREKQEVIENAILKFFNETGLESAKTPHGTAYVSTVMNARVADRDTFFEFVRRNDAWDMLESRANKTAVREYIEEAGETPPGVDIAQIRKINIRK